MIRSMVNRRIIGSNLSVLGIQSRTPRLCVARFMSTQIDINEYHQKADWALEYISDAYINLGGINPEVDAELEQGVLTLTLPPNGTYVINKQPFNRQIWLSSPISGPKRYDWIDGKWIYNRDSSSLGNLLRDETKKITETNEDIQLHFLEELD